MDHRLGSGLRIQGNAFRQSTTVSTASAGQRSSTQRTTITQMETTVDQVVLLAK